MPKATKKTAGKARAVGKRRKAVPKPFNSTRQPGRESSSEEWSSSDGSSSGEDNAVLVGGSVLSNQRRPEGSMPLAPRTEVADQKLRKKIAKGEFIDFKLLLAKSAEKSIRRFAINDGLLEEVEETSRLPFYDWLDAWLVYSSVYLEFFPDQHQGMIRHQQVIKKMHGLGRDCIEYDRQFRLLKSRNPDIRWGEYLTELANEFAMPVPQRKPAPRNVGAHRNVQGPSGNGRTAWLTAQSNPCFRFNSQLGCTLGAKCRFAHKCSRCLGVSHPVMRCRKN